MSRTVIQLRRTPPHEDYVSSSQTRGYPGVPDRKRRKDFEFPACLKMSKFRRQTFSQVGVCLAEELPAAADVKSLQEHENS